MGGMVFLESFLCNEKGILFHRDCMRLFRARGNAGCVVAFLALLAIVSVIRVYKVHRDATHARSSLSIRSVSNDGTSEYVLRSTAFRPASPAYVALHGRDRVRRDPLLAVVIVVRSSRFPMDHLRELIAQRTMLHHFSLPFEVIIAADAGRFGEPTMNQVERALSDLFLHVHQAHGVVRITLVVVHAKQGDMNPTFAWLASRGELQASETVDHVLFMSEAHTPYHRRFIERMYEPFSLTITPPVWAVQCTIVDPTFDTGDPDRVGAVLDRGMDFSETVNHKKALFALVRNMHGFPLRDSRLRSIQSIHVLTPYCSMWTRTAFHQISNSSQIGRRQYLGALQSLWSARDEVVAYGVLLLAVLRNISAIEAEKAPEGFMADMTEALKRTKENPDLLYAVSSPSSATQNRTVRELASSLRTPTKYTQLRELLAGLKNAHIRFKGLFALWDEERDGWEASLRVHQLGGTMFVSRGLASFLPQLLPDTLAQFYEGITVSPAAPSRYFSSDMHERWKDVVRSLTRTRPSALLRVVWDSTSCACSGFSNEIVHFVYPLSRLREVQTMFGPECLCSGFPSCVVDVFNRSYIKTPSDGRGRKAVWIHHTVPLNYRVFDPVDQPAYQVGRSMFEFSRIPQSWVAKMERVQEVWVPTRFVSHSFRVSGVPANKIVIVPEAVDTAFLDPEVHDPLTLPHEMSRKKWSHYCNREGNVGAYKFFSNFKWEPRKGWEILMEAYWRAFRHPPADDRPVSLYILSYLYMAPNIYDPAEVARRILSWAKAAHNVSSLAELPHFCVISDNLSGWDVARLYRSVNAFVLPTRGEGWGLPIIEAMAMGLPAIATAWGGQVDFMLANNSFLIRVDAVEEPPEDIVYGYEPGMKWATPSTAHTAQLMKYVYSHPQHAVAVGKRARAHVAKYFNEDALARVVDHRLQRIHRFLNNETT